VDGAKRNADGPQATVRASVSTFILCILPFGLLRDVRRDPPSGRRLLGFLNLDLFVGEEKRQEPSHCLIRK